MDGNNKYGVVGVVQALAVSMAVLVESWCEFCVCVCVFRIPDSIGKDIEKACQSIYPLHDVYVRKVKMLKKPKFEREFN